MVYERSSTADMSSLKRTKMHLIDLNLLVVGHVGAGKSSFIRTLLETLPIRGIRVSQPGYAFMKELGGVGEMQKNAGSSESIGSASHKSYNTSNDDAPPPTTLQDLIGLLPVDNNKCVYAAPYRWTINCSSDEKVSLLVIDSQGLPTPTKNSSRDRVAALTTHANEILQNIMNFLEVRFEVTLLEESKVKRNPKGPDHKIHATIYLLDPNVCMENNGLTSIDVYALKKICVATNVILCLGKADSISIMDLIILRQKICADVAQNEIPIYSFEGAEDEEHNKYGDDEIKISDIHGSNDSASYHHLSYSNAVLNSSVNDFSPFTSVDDSVPVQKYNFSVPFTILNSEALRGDYYENFDIRNKCNATVIEQLQTPVKRCPNLKTQILTSSLCTDNNIREKLSNNKFVDASSNSFSKSKLDNFNSTNNNSTYVDNISKFSGRIYPWGVLYCDNPDHCDLLRIKQILLCTHIREFIFLSKFNCYEQWRTAKLLEIRNSLIETSKFPPDSNTKSDNNFSTISQNAPSEQKHEHAKSDEIHPITSTNQPLIHVPKSTDSVSYYKPELVKNSG